MLVLDRACLLLLCYSFHFSYQIVFPEVSVSKSLLCHSPRGKGTKVSVRLRSDTHFRMQTMSMGTIRIALGLERGFSSRPNEPNKREAKTYEELHSRRFTLQL